MAPRLVPRQLSPAGMAPCWALLGRGGLVRGEAGARLRLMGCLLALINVLVNPF